MVIIREVGRADNKVSSLNLCKEERRRREGGEGERGNVHAYVCRRLHVIMLSVAQEIRASCVFRPNMA